MRKQTLWIAQTAVFIALLIVSQAATAPLGNTLVTGSIVNLILVVSAMLCGIESGLTVAAISPIFAKLFGIGPLWTLIPFIMLGNAVLVLVWSLIGRREIGKNKLVPYSIATVLAAAAKFATLYLGIVQIAIPFMLNLPAPQAEKISATFSVPQLFTALIGGAVATAILPVLSKAVKSLKK